MVPFLFVLMLLAGCTPKPIPSNPTFQDVKPILQMRCMSCHNDSIRPHGHSTNWLNETVFKERLDIIKERVIIKRNMPVGSVLPKQEYETIKNYLEGMQ
jgi:hypothetical protein